MLSLKNFQDAKLANDAISKISEYGKDFIPQVFDYYEPLKKKYDASYTQSIVDIDYFKESNHFELFISLCKDIVELLEPVYCSISNCSFPDWGEPINLRVRLPNIVWGTIFGKPYMNMFCKEKLLKTPCYKTEAIGEKAVFFRLQKTFLTQ